MDGCVSTPHPHIVLFTCPFVCFVVDVVLIIINSGRHVNFSLLRSIQFSFLSSCPRTFRYAQILDIWVGVHELLQVLRSMNCMCGNVSSAV